MVSRVVRGLYHFTNAIGVFGFGLILKFCISEFHSDCYHGYGSKMKMSTCRGFCQSIRRIKMSGRRSFGFLPHDDLML